MFHQQFPMYGEYDVVVIGGGTAGFAAATTAARGGAKTLVLEKDAFLGGMATGGMVSQFLGFLDGEEAVGGVMGEVLERLAQRNATTGIYWIKMGGVYPTKTAGYDHDVLKQILDELVLESGADMLFHTKVVGVLKVGDRIDGLVIHNTQGCQVVKGQVFIDATFHGEIAAEAGCQWEKGRPGDGVLQPGSLIFRMANIDYEQFERLGKEEKRNIALRGIADGKLCVDVLYTRPVTSEKKLFHFNQSRVAFDPLSAKSLTMAEVEGRRQVQQIADYYRQHVPGFEKAMLVSTGAYLGQRDSRRIIGKYVLRKEDIMAGTKFSDAVVASSYPIDIHDPKGTGGVFIKPEGGVYYIPYRCMVNDAVPNLLVAGRCISATYEAHAGFRTMVPCVKLGEAAGAAAAVGLATGKAVSELDGSVISGKLLG